MTFFYERIKNHSMRECLKSTIRNIWTHSSTAIEGNTLSLGDTAFVLQEGLTISGKTVREHNEIIGHAQAIDILYDLVSNDSKISAAELFKLHKAVMLNPVVDIYAPVGKWKIEANFTQVINASGKVEYKEYPKPEAITGLMKQWFSLINNPNNEDLLIQYCKLHISFAAIHPFADGNGRIARLLANIPVIKAGLVPITIANESRREYIQLLQNSAIDDDLNITKGLDEFITFADNEWQNSLNLYEQAVRKT
jgi:Fic family protein